MNRINVIHLGFSFFLIFLSFNVTKTFQTSSDHPRDGALVVGIVFSVFCVANLGFSSYLLNLLGIKPALILTSATYAFFDSREYLF